MPPKTRLALVLLCLLTTGLPAASLRETPAVRAIRRATPAVVNIRSEKTVANDNVLYASRPNQKVSGMGTGVIVDRRGYIVTNHHVISGVDWLRVTLSDGSIHDAKVLSYDRPTDLAIIKINSKRPLPEMALGTSSDLMLAETVFAVGNAYGYEDTVTCGIISALHREVEVNEKQTYHNLIQTDASINPGNSGGPLINLEGEVVGINVAIRSGAQRIGFAIPIDDARRVIADLLSIDRLSGTWHGVQTRDDKQGMRRQLVVTGAVSSSPATTAGLKSGDIITAAGDVTVVDGVDLERALLGHKAGSKVQLTVTRQGKQTSVPLVLASRRQEPTTAQSGINDRTWASLGIRLEVVDRRELGRRHGKKVLKHYRGGLRITAIRKNGPAKENGIRKGDVLVGLHEWETVNMDNIRYVLEHSRLTEFNPIKFYVLRDTETLFGHLPVRNDAR
ncbi:MAG: serine protease [Planctomycetaceae bacterium]|jgi:serine protease Do|nr:serine protease [Planctomycetaceae bacterium]